MRTQFTLVAAGLLALSVAGPVSADITDNPHTFPVAVSCPDPVGNATVWSTRAAPYLPGGAEAGGVPLLLRAGVWWFTYAGEQRGPFGAPPDPAPGMASKLIECTFVFDLEGHHTWGTYWFQLPGL